MSVDFNLRVNFQLCVVLYFLIETCFKKIPFFRRINNFDTSNRNFNTSNRNIGPLTETLAPLTHICFSIHIKNSSYPKSSSLLKNGIYEMIED